MAESTTTSRYCGLSLKPSRADRIRTMRNSEYLPSKRVGKSSKQNHLNILYAMIKTSNVWHKITKLLTSYKDTLQYYHIIVLYKLLINRAVSKLSTARRRRKYCHQQLCCY